jgi:thiol-disulfide isomerase/thioredoxin
MHRFAASALVLVASFAFAQEDLAAVDKPAPAFRLPLYNAVAAGEPAGMMLGLDQFSGPEAKDKGAKLIVVSFMASFCGPCKKEMPYLQSLSEKYRPLGLRVMMVAIDKEEEGQKKVAELIETNKVTFPVLKDRFNIVARRWLGTQSPLPSLFLLRPDGTVKSVHRGYSDDASTILDREIAAALASK